MTLSVLPNFSGRRTAIETKCPANDRRKSPVATARAARENAANTEHWRSLRLQNDWQVLANEWLALTATLEQFEREFERLEQSLHHRWERRASALTGTASDQTETKHE